MISTLRHFPVDPAYGTGSYRRLLRFVAGQSGVAAQVDDSHHSYWLTLDHDGERVISIDAGFNRAPTNMCTGATVGLASLIGLPLATPTSDLVARLPRTSNCTHLSDLAVWALAHVDSSSTWEIEVPDQVASPVWIMIMRDSQIIHRWEIADFHVTAPENLAERPLMAGFMRWAGECFEADELLAATMLQRGVFVARGRQHIVDQGEPMPLSSAAGMAGMCWSYSDERLSSGTGTLRYVRDFSRTIHPETPPLHVAKRFEDARP